MPCFKWDAPLGGSAWQLSYGSTAQSSPGPYNYGMTRRLCNEPKRPLKTMHAAPGSGFALSHPVLNPFSHMIVVGEPYQPL